MNTKFYFSIILAALFITAVEKSDAQAPDWLWANSISGDIYHEPGCAISVDPTNGDVFTMGTFWGTVDFDPGEGTYYLTVAESDTDPNLFISKLDSSGHFLWVRSWAGIVPHCSFRGCFVNFLLTVDHGGSGDIYITGDFENGTVDFDPGPNTFNLTANENSQAYVCKMDRSGNFVWAKSIGGNGSTVLSNSIAIDPSINGHVYISGSYTGTVDFDTGSDTLSLTSNENGKVFISKLDSSGHFVWAKAIGDSANVYGYVHITSLVVGAGKGDVYITGSFGGTIDFNPGPGIFNLTSTGNINLFISKLDSSGNFLFAKSIDGWSIGRSIAVSTGIKDIIILGEFSETVDFDPGSITFNLTSIGDRNLFITKLDSAGNFLWVKPMGTYFSGERSKSLILDQGSGDIYSTGIFYGTIDFDTGPDTFNLTSSGESDIYISKLDSSGNFVWAMSIKSTDYEEHPSIDIDALGKVYVGGTTYSPDITFDSTTLIKDDTNYSSLFIAKLGTALTTSIAEIKKYPINIYPNPATNELTIEFEGDEFFNVDITLFNVLGEVVYFSPAENIGRTKNIDISALAAGIYFVELRMNGSSVIKKVVKE